MSIREKILVLMIVGIFTMGQVSLCFASGYEGPGVGTRQVTMGGAYIGLADDWTAIYWNPAGLTQLKGGGGGLEIAYPIFGLTCPAGDSNESTQVKEAKIRPKLFLPNMGYYHRLKDWTLAGGIYTQVGAVVDWSGTVNGDDVSGLNELEIMVGSLSVARKVASKLSLGLGLNILYGRNKNEQDKELTNPFPFPNININYEAEADGFGYEGVLGILYKVHPKLSLGGVYRSGTDIELEGKATVCQRTTRRIIDEDSSGYYTGALAYPSTYGLGLAFRPVDRLILTADWTRTDWTRMRKEIEYDHPGGTLENKNDDLGWKTINRYRFGTEYNLTDNWDLRAGLYTDPSPLSEDGISLGPLTEVDKIAYTFGVSYKRKNFQIDLGYILVNSKGEAEGKSYVEEINFSRITLSYGR